MFSLFSTHQRRYTSAEQRGFVDSDLTNWSDGWVMQCLRIITLTQESHFHALRIWWRESFAKLRNELTRKCLRFLSPPFIQRDSLF